MHDLMVVGVRMEYYKIDGGGGKAGAAGAPAYRPPPQVLAQLTPPPRRRPPSRREPERRKREREGKRGGVLRALAGILDAPYSFVQEEGWGAVERLKTKAFKEKRRGETAKAFLYALGASTASFATGVAAGVTGLISPRAWRETFQAIKNPGETLKAIAGDPMSWPYLAGSIVGPAKIGRAASRPRVLEPDLAGLRGEGIILGKVSGSGHRWVAALELEAPAVEVKGKPPKPGKRYFTVATPRGWAEVAEVKTKRGVVRARVVRLRGGKIIRIAEEWRLEGGRFKARVIVSDPEPVLAQRKVQRKAPRAAAETVASIIGELEPPRVAVGGLRSAALGAAAGITIGAGGAAGRARARRGAAPLSAPGGLPPLLPPRGSPKGGTPLLPAGSRRKLRRRGDGRPYTDYYEILYPGATLKHILGPGT